MVQIIIGCIAFLMFFVGDFNDWRLANPVLKFCFPLGIILMIMATAVGLFTGDGIKRILLVIPSAMFLFLLIYTLFFALKADEAYVSQQRGRKVCSTGVYSICRHPGVLWFFGLYVCLYFMGIVNLGSLIIFNVLNVILVAFEDKYVFPSTMTGYAEYQQSVPFLLPTIKKKTVRPEGMTTEN